LFGSKDAEVARADHETTVQAVVTEFGTYFMGLVGQRRAQPTSDLGSVLANATIDGQLLEPPDLVPYFILLTAAGHDTVSMVLAGGVEALARWPDQLEKLRNEPGLIPNAVEEVVRWVTPTKHFMRTVAFDTELHGTPLRRGDWVLLSYPSANRDEEVFVDPFRFDVERGDVSKHVGFGVGAHFCIGAPLARMELRTFFEELVPRLEHLEIAGPVERSQTTFVATFKKLPIRWQLTPS
jgi:cytochrome P450